MHFFDDSAVQESQKKRGQAGESADLSKSYLWSASIVQIVIALGCFAGAYWARAPFSWIFLAIGVLLLFVVTLFGVGSWGLWFAHRDVQYAFSTIAHEEHRSRCFLDQFKPSQDAVYLDLKAAAEDVARALELYQEGLRVLSRDSDSQKRPQELFEEKADRYESAFQKAASTFYVKRDAARNVGYVVPVTWETYVEEGALVLVEDKSEQPGQ